MPTIGDSTRIAPAAAAGSTGSSRGLRPRRARVDATRARAARRCGAPRRACPRPRSRPRRRRSPGRSGRARGSAARGVCSSVGRRAPRRVRRARGSSAAAPRPPRRRARAGRAPPRSPRAPRPRRARPRRSAGRRRAGSPSESSATARATVGSIGAGGRAVAALDERAELVDDRAVAPRREHVEERLRREDLADRRRERRRAGLAADRLQLLEHLEQPVAGRVRAQVRVERGDEAGRQVVLGRAHGDARRRAASPARRRCTRRRGRDASQSRSTSTPGVEPQPRERRGERLARDAVQRERERVDGARDQVGAGARGLERVGEPRAGGALAVEADGQARTPRRRGRRARPPGAARARRSGRGSARASRRARRARAPARRARPSAPLSPGL